MSRYVEIFQVTKTFATPSGPQVIVENFDLVIDEGEFVSLIGHSGCGKSTILNMCSGLIPVTKGSIAVARREIDGPGPDRGMVFQSPCLLPWLTAHGNVLLAVDRVFPNVARSERYDIAAHYLELVGLGDALNRNVKLLSQGMQQRVGIARAFATSPKMLLLDEPFGMLDSLTRMELQEVLMELLARDRKTTLLVTHDVDEALFLSDRIVMMTTGPKAKVGGILAPTFPRPRNRQQVLDSPDYYEQRDTLIEFLESQDRSHRAKSEPASMDSPRPSDPTSMAQTPEELTGSCSGGGTSGSGMIAPLTDTASPSAQQTVVVIGNGMVGLRFCEKLIAADPQRRYRIVTFCEEPRAAYDRVGLTSFFAHWDAEKLLLARKEWYLEHGVELHIGDRANAIDRQRKVVTSDKRREVAYDYVVLATGSYPFVPPVPGIDKSGIFVYRTIEDLERMIAYASHAKSCAVIGGGLLGLEAAKAVNDLGLQAHVIEYNGRLMPRQIDDSGSRVLVKKIEALGVQVHLNKGTKEILGKGKIEGIEFQDGSTLDVDMLVVSTGIRPRDELAKQSGLDVGSRGGIVVDDQLRTSDPCIYAIGECALHAGMVYGLVAPGYEMADTLASVLTGGDKRFSGADLSTKLKLMGVDVASFGNYEAGPDKAVPLSFEDPFNGKYKKLLFSTDGERLLGGILVGDASEYGQLSLLAKSGQKLPCPPHEFIVGSSGGGVPGGGVDNIPDAVQICSCHNVSKGAICSSMRDGGCDSLAAVKSCTKAGTGCGGCMPLVTDIFKAELKKAGKTVTNHLCEHFLHSRTELFAIIKVKELKTFADVLEHCGRGQGCEVCKPAVASILASLWNDVILNDPHATLQDTNDRFLANIQRGGTYSVVPRVPGGEITPEKLIVLGEVAQEFGLYTKITGGQRIDLFGARVQDLPAIWERLINAGFESGHAYGKSLRTVKSCVGSTWCRYGVQDSVGFAIRVENRYKGIRAPHKIKMAVSGCVRECAEAQGKDVGLVATDKGYNLYVCGNGGAKPRHADLIAADLDEETALRYIDRFLMYYIMTADKLTRTSVWLEKLEGGLEHLREVIIEDKLGLAAELEARLQYLVDTYQCEWAAVVNDPVKRQRFQQFVNTEEAEPCIEVISERNQCRPADWPTELVSLQQFHELEQLTSTPAADELRWVPLGVVSDFPPDGGATVKYGGVQIAIFNFASRGEWYACQNMCPHKKAFVLSRGMIGDQAGTPKVACPLHKKTFSLEDGQSLQGEEYHIQTFPVRVEGNRVLLQLPAPEVLEQSIGTEVGCRLATSCGEAH